jgi:hypothetical protein
MAQFKVLSQHLSEETEEDYENICQYSRFSGRDTNPGPLEYEAGVLITRLRRLIT